MRYVLQTHAWPDNVTDEGEIHTRRPYPLVIDALGYVESPIIDRVIGFTTDLHAQRIDHWWPEVVVNEALIGRIPGMYAVISDKKGDWATLGTAVETLREYGK